MLKISLDQGPMLPESEGTLPSSGVGVFSWRGWISGEAVWVSFTSKICSWNWSRLNGSTIQVFLTLSGQWEGGAKGLEDVIGFEKMSQAPDSIKLLAQTKFPGFSNMAVKKGLNCRGTCTMGEPGQGAKCWNHCLINSDKQASWFAWEDAKPGSTIG